MQVSKIWLCWPSAFKPAVGPNVVSDAGEPASPKAAAAAKSTTICCGLNPKCVQTGINKTANIGIVPKDVPIPIVINNPIIKITSDVRIILFGKMPITRFTSESIAPVSFKTDANPAATSITKAI